VDRLKGEAEENARLEQTITILEHAASLQEQKVQSILAENTSLRAELQQLRHGKKQSGLLSTYCESHAPTEERVKSTPSTRAYLRLSGDDKLTYIADETIPDVPASVTTETIILAAATMERQSTDLHEARPPSGEPCEHQAPLFTESVTWSDLESVQIPQRLPDPVDFMKGALLDYAERSSDIGSDYDYCDHDRRNDMLSASDDTSFGDVDGIRPSEHPESEVGHCDLTQLRHGGDIGHAVSWSSYYDRISWTIRKIPQTEDSGIASLSSSLGAKVDARAQPCSGFAEYSKRPCPLRDDQSITKAGLDRIKKLELDARRLETDLAGLHRSC
jgi:hypothetical protein